MEIDHLGSDLPGVDPLLCTVLGFLTQGRRLLAQQFLVRGGGSASIAAWTMHHRRPCRLAIDFCAAGRRIQRPVAGSFSPVSWRRIQSCTSSVVMLPMVAGVGRPARVVCTSSERWRSTSRR